MLADDPSHKLAKRAQPCRRCVRSCACSSRRREDGSIVTRSVAATTSAAALNEGTVITISRGMLAFATSRRRIAEALAGDHVHADVAEIVERAARYRSLRREGGGIGTVGMAIAFHFRGR